MFDELNEIEIWIIKLKKMLGIQIHHQNGFYPNAEMGPSIHYVSKIDNPIGTIPILRQQRGWVGGVRKMAISADVHYYLSSLRVSGWVGLKKSKNVLTLYRDGPICRSALLSKVKSGRVHYYHQ